MVVVRFRSVDQATRQVIVKQETHQVDNSNNNNNINMFKVPSSTSSSHQLNSQHQQHQQLQHAEMLAAAKRKWQEANSPTLGLAAPPERPQQKQKTSSPPLTIFYGGAVNVYENVPESMVRALMTLAAAKSSKPGAAMLSHLQKANNVNVNMNNNNNTSVKNNGFGFQTAVTPAPSTGFGLAVVQPHQAQREDTSLSLNSFNNSSKPEEKSPPPPPLSSTSSAPPSGDPSRISSVPRMQLLPTGLPQARRASIQRFLEKRKQKQVVDDNNQEDGDPGKTIPTPCDVPHFLRLGS